MTTEGGIISKQSQSLNPFEITKAVDFTDSQIDATWVDWPAPGGFAARMDVKSPMARIILGGKGVGRTHVMRYFSAQVQAIRGGYNPVEQVLQDGVLGIYVLCSGLNSSRFRGRGFNEETWESIFSHYADVWLGQAALAAFAKITEKDPPAPSVQEAITEDIRALLHNNVWNSGQTLDNLREDLFQTQREIDIAVNNAALHPGEPLDITIRSTPGSLVFGVPNALSRHYSPLDNIRYLYLIDEFENFEIPQQRYVNTLIREKEAGTSFMIGVRTYGLRTLGTLSAGEENKHGSEFEEIRLNRNDTTIDRKNYYDFCQRVVARRLAEHALMDDTAATGIDGLVEAFFELPSPDHEEQLVLERYKDREPPYIAHLRRQLLLYRSPTSRVPLSLWDIEFITQSVRVPSRPLLEKVNVFLLFREWADGEDLMVVARKMLEARPTVDHSGKVLPNDAQRHILDHYVTDMQAQLQRDLRSDQIYAGIKEFIAMSDGLPRNLLVILKNIYRWAMFQGEQPFRGGKISLGSQQKGVLEAADWFLADAKPLGEDGEAVQDGIHRLGEFFRRLRFSDKPVESSLASFSANLTACSQRAREVIKISEERALLIPVRRGQKQRATRLVEAKFHLNRLLSPRWDLPTARRGAVALNSTEVNAIFDPYHADKFSEIVNRRLKGMNAPFGQPQDDSVIQEAFDFEDY